MRTINRPHLDRILQLLTGHGGGYVFFDRQGRAVWLSQERLGKPPRLDTADLYMFYASSQLVAPDELRPLGSSFKLAIIRAGIGQRMRMDEAIALLQDFL